MTAAEIRSYARLLANENNTTRLTDAELDLYLQGALEAFNRRVGYRYTDGTITWVAGTAEYDLPSDFVQAEWLEYNGLFLKKSTEAEWRSKGEDWRNRTGTPEEYAIYGLKAIFYPKPNLAGTVTVRYRSASGTFAAAELALIGSQDHRLLAYYAVAEWFGTARSPVTAWAAAATHWQERFNQEAELAAIRYSARGMES